MSSLSNESLEHEIEAIRERLAGTIDELLYRTNPKVVAGRQVSSVKARFVDPQTGVTNTAAVTKAAAIAVAVVVGFAILRKVARR